MNAAGKEKIYMTIAWNFCIHVIADITCWPLVGFLPEETSPTNCLFFGLFYSTFCYLRTGKVLTSLWMMFECVQMETEKHCHGVKGRGRPDYWHKGSGCVGMNQERTKTNQPFIGSGSLPADRTHASSDANYPTLSLSAAAFFPPFLPQSASVSPVNKSRPVAAWAACSGTANVRFFLFCGAMCVYMITG